MLLPASPLAGPSHPDIITSDRLAPAVSHRSSKSVSSQLTSYNTPPSSPSFSMGQVVSRPQVDNTVLPSSSPSCSGNSLTSPGSRFKLALGRRRKPELRSQSSDLSQAKEPFVTDDPVYGTITTVPARQLGARQLTLQLASHIFGRKQSDSVPPSPALDPPPLPPKHGVQQSGLWTPSSNVNLNERPYVATMTNSAIAPALGSIKHSDEIVEPLTKENERKDSDKSELKEIRRKSDSTLSHHTIRPGVGSRTPRPVSFAESFQSAHTVVPVNNRLSALITDAEYATPEEDNEEDEDEEPCMMDKSTPSSRRVSPSSSLKMRNRRSQSLNFGPSLSLLTAAPTAAQASVSLDAIPSPVLRSGSDECGRLPPASATIPTFSLPSRPASADSRVHLGPRAQVSLQRALPDLPPAQHRSHLSHSTLPSFRQTTVSMTSGLAPAAGLARRAVEKMGRVWGSKSLSPSPLAAPVVTSSSSFPMGIPSRIQPSHSEFTNYGMKARDKLNAPSIHSTAPSLTDYEGPQLGQCLRGPLHISSRGIPESGLVFGRDLDACVKDTAADAVCVTLRAHRLDTTGTGGIRTRKSRPSAPLEERLLPALVLRCTQHILTWGVQEQGIFRVSGRSSHMVKLRSEFDTGADFDIKEATPGDLDPHAVASIFKAYLRELPEPLLTNGLMPSFDAAMTSERSTNNSQEDAQPNFKDIRAGIPKPLSISAFTMPSLSGTLPSESLRRALSSLIDSLPQENRDLLLTVTEVINFTARRSQDTRMPLSNLLPILYPTLGIKLSLLQALCECQDIWDGAIQTKATDLTLDQLPHEYSKPMNDSTITFEAASSTIRIHNKRVRPLPVTPVDVESQSVTSTSSVPRHRTIPSHPTTATAVGAELSETSSLTTDDGSSASHVSQGGRPVTPTSMNFRLTNPYTPPSLSSSADSLSVGSLSSGSPACRVKDLPFIDDLHKSQSSSLTRSMTTEFGPVVVPFPSSKATPQSQFQFPAAGETARPPLVHKKSFSSSVSGDARMGSVVSRAKRMKKPSLHLLFSRRPASPFSATPDSQPSANGNSTPLSNQHDSPWRSSPSSGSPASMVTAPQSSRFSYPPVLNTAIDESSISLALGLQNEETCATAVGHSSTSDVTQRQEKHSSSGSTNGSTTETKVPRLDVPLNGEDGDDAWTQSVLLAASEPRW